MYIFVAIGGHIYFAVLMINGTRKPSWCWHTRATQNDEKNSSISKL